MCDFFVHEICFNGEPGGVAALLPFWGELFRLSIHFVLNVR